MCGVFGFVAKGDKGPEPKRLERIALATQARGRHAFGFSWVDARGRVRMYKQTGAVGDSLGVLAMLAGARMVIGHCRYATHGNAAYSVNNHPHPCDGGWLVHNGVVRNYEQVVDRHKLHPVGHCDSEVLALLVEQIDGHAVDRCISAAAECKTGPLVLLALWRARLVAVRSGNPLCVGENERGWYLGSFSDGLPGDAYPLRDHVAVEFTARKGQMQMRGFDASAELAGQIQTTFC